MVATKSGYAAFSASTVPMLFSVAAISFSSFGFVLAAALLFIKPPGLCGLFNNTLGTVLKAEMSMGVELTTIFEAFSMTVFASSNINSSQKPFVTASSPVHHFSSLIKAAIASAPMPVFIA